MKTWIYDVFFSTREVYAHTGITKHIRRAQLSSRAGPGTSSTPCIDPPAAIPRDSNLPQGLCQATQTCAHPIWIPRGAWLRSLHSCNIRAYANAYSLSYDVIFCCIFYFHSFYFIFIFVSYILVENLGFYIIVMQVYKFGVSNSFFNFFIKIYDNNTNLSKWFYD